jgi:hypothetical protein
VVKSLGLMTLTAAIALARAFPNNPDCKGDAKNSGKRLIISICTTISGGFNFEVMLFYCLPSGDHLFVRKIPELRLCNQLFASVMIFSLAARVIIIKLCF